MTPRIIVFAATVLALASVWPIASMAETATPLPVPPGSTEAQVQLGNRIFHGEAAGGTCVTCHGPDAKGTAFGNDLTTGMFIWSDGSIKMLKATISNNALIAPGRDGQLTPADIDAVTAYVWAISHGKQ